MEPGMIVLLGLTFSLSLLSITLSLVTLRLSRRRVKALEASVAPWGWHVLRSSAVLDRRWSGHPFRKAFYRRAGLNVTGPFQGRPAIVFEYSAVSLERFETTTVCVLAAPGLFEGLDLTILDREDELTKGSAGQDVLTGSPEFDAVWRVRSTDPERALALVGPELRDLLMEPSAGPLRAVPGEIMTWREGTLRLRKVHPTLEWLTRAEALLLAQPSTVTPAPPSLLDEGS